MKTVLLTDQYCGNSCAQESIRLKSPSIHLFSNVVAKSNKNKHGNKDKETKAITVYISKWHNDPRPQ